MPRVALVDRGRFEPEASIPPLEPGDCLTRDEFERRYEAMPGKTKFELIDGIVYMASPVKLTHAFFQTALGAFFDDYALATPGCLALVDPTVRLAKKDEPRPDALLRIDAEAGGVGQVDRDDYLAGPVELAAEVATSTASYDLNQKKRAYLRHGVLEYLAIVTRTSEVFWFARERDEYHLLEPDRQGVIRSRVFPGLWLNVPALLARDRHAVKRTAAKGIRSRERAAFARLLEGRMRRKK
ncbi:MAG TPA: Uma2 family endonuclease [Planctomycetota bacterium]|nr:Uma2 family endonuclease [Planctomycetota bacterium]